MDDKSGIIVIGVGWLPREIIGQYILRIRTQITQAVLHRLHK